MRRSTTAALNEHSYLLVGGPGCRKQFRGAVDAQEFLAPLGGATPPASSVDDFALAFRPFLAKLISGKARNSFRREFVTAVQQGAALQQREKFHG